MKKPVHDALVAEYAKRLRSGGPLGEVFPCPVSECEFTEAQKLLIKEARKARAKLPMKPKPRSATPPQPKITATPLKPAAPVHPSAQKPQSLKKLEKMLFLQHGKCFFCGEKLLLTDANIEHLQPLSLGGTRAEDNEVVCHKSLNETFGNMALKQKIEFVIKAAGSFRCP